jgi:hypothetical protein
MSLDPLALTDDELKMVTEAASLLRPHERDNFLNNVATLFVASGNLPNSIRFALSGYGVAAGKYLFANGARHDRRWKKEWEPSPGRITS